MDHAFGSDFTVGIEEELLVTDAGGASLAATSAAVIEAMGVDERLARHDLYAAQLELSSRPCRSAVEAGEELAGLRAKAREVGATLVGAGLHPAAPFGEAGITDAPRYETERENLRGVVARTPDCALHVHVGMPDVEHAVRAFNGLRDHLPLLTALAGNSPYWHGRDSGLATARLILRRGFPRVEVPRAVRDIDDYEALVGTILLAGELDDYSFIWWDIRLHPRLGTVEVRVMDAQAPLTAVTGIAALIQGLARHEATERIAPYRTREEISETMFRASAHGMQARLLDGERMRSVPELAREAVELARPHARELDSDAPLDEIERIVRDGNGADRQRAAHANGGIAAVVDLLVEETRA